jgi:hypothetical protein
MATETTTQKIRIACHGSRLAPLASLEVIQGDLKELSTENYAKLRQRIETKGFDAPVFVWRDKILDGTQRCRVLGTMLADGWELPGGLVPVCDIEAADLEEAKERLLGYVSQYGRVTEDGLREILDGMEVPDLDTVVLPGVNLGADGPEVGPDDTRAASGRPDQSAGQTRQMEVMCPECGYEFMIDVI